MCLYRAGNIILNALRTSKLVSPYRLLSPLLLRHSAVVPPPFAASFIRHAASFIRLASTGHGSSSRMNVGTIEHVDHGKTTLTSAITKVGDKVGFPLRSLRREDVLRRQYIGKIHAVQPIIQQRRGISSRPFMAWFGIARVPQGMVFIIERNFQYKKTLTPGLHFIVPILDRVASTQSLKEQNFVIHQIAVSKDWIQMSVYMYTKLKITDPTLALYATTGDPIHETTMLAKYLLSMEVGEIDFQQIQEEKKELTQKIMMELKKKSNETGITCLEFFMDVIYPPDRISDEAKPLKEKNDEAKEAQAQWRSDVRLMTREIIWIILYVYAIFTILQVIFKEISDGYNNVKANRNGNKNGNSINTNAIRPTETELN